MRGAPTTMNQLIAQAAERARREAPHGTIVRAIPLPWLHQITDAISAILADHMTVNRTEGRQMIEIIPKNESYVHPRCGLGVVVVTPKGIVLMQRAPGKHGAGTWSLPGGGQERGETLIEAAEREVLEELGVRLSGTVLLPYITEDMFVPEGQHWNTFYALGITEDTPVNMEPTKCSGLFIGWPQDFPQPFFVGVQGLLDRNLIPREPGPELRNRVIKFQDDLFLSWWNSGSLF